MVKNKINSSCKYEKSTYIGFKQILRVVNSKTCVDLAYYAQACLKRFQIENKVLLYIKLILLKTIYYKIYDCKSKF
jgi:hypothetical protein